MSKILEQLKQAEERRQRIVAERKRVESEADAALAARDLDERTGRARDEAQVRAAAEAARLATERGGQPEYSGKIRWLAAGAVVAAGIFSVFFFFGASNEKETAAVGSPAAGFPLKLDRDLESFAKRLQEKERP